MSEPLTNLTKAACAGGKLQPTESNAPAELLEGISVSMFHIGAKCKRAYRAFKERKNVDSDFLTNQEIKDRLDSMHEAYMKARAESIAQLNEHAALRELYFKREAVKRQLRELKEAEAKLFADTNI